MTTYNSTANYIFNLVLQVLLTAYLTWEMLLYGRVGWAVALILVNLAAIGINLMNLSYLVNALFRTL